MRIGSLSLSVHLTAVSQGHSNRSLEAQYIRYGQFTQTANAKIFLTGRYVLGKGTRGHGRVKRERRASPRKWQWQWQISVFGSCQSLFTVNHTIISCLFFSECGGEIKKFYLVAQLLDWIP